MEPGRPRRPLIREALSHHDPRRWTTTRRGQRRHFESPQTAEDTFAHHELDVRATRGSDTHPDQVGHVHTKPHERPDLSPHAKADTQQDAWPAGPFPEA
ncbi:hypothetical protein [Actinopolymorpha pittospori]